MRGMKRDLCSWQLVERCFVVVVVVVVVCLFVCCLLLLLFGGTELISARSKHKKVQTKAY